jgi:hypothetical protein
MSKYLDDVGSEYLASKIIALINAETINLGALPVYIGASSTGGYYFLGSFPVTASANKSILKFEITYHTSGSWLLARTDSYLITIKNQLTVQRLGFGADANSNITIEAYTQTNARTNIYVHRTAGTYSQITVKLGCSRVGEETSVDLPYWKPSTTRLDTPPGTFLWSSSSLPPQDYMPYTN